MEHRWIDVGGGTNIHVADAGPVDGPPIMLVHGFPQNWWEWQELIGPLAADGYRVLCPDLRGAGWSSAPRDRYFKTDMAADLAVVLERLAVGPVRLVAHDWGGPIAIIMMLRHPEKVSGFFGLNTIGPWMTLDLAFMRDAWRFWYQIPMMIPYVGPRLISDPKGRYFRLLCRWGGGFIPPDFDLYVRHMGEPGRAIAASRWWRTFQLHEMLHWLRGRYADAHFEAPVRWLHGIDDPVISPTLLRDYSDRFSDFELEIVDGAGHWIVEQRPELVLDRLRAFIRET
jgi:pimeloyl-ACP methyl ester carboxylesterase